MADADACASRKLGLRFKNWHLLYGCHGGRLECAGDKFPVVQVMDVPTPIAERLYEESRDCSESGPSCESCVICEC
jgi:hypothetical protein